MQNTPVSHSKDEIIQHLNSVEIATVSTVSGSSVRNRMMHFAFDSDFNFYLATMKNDPKTLQMTRQPSVSLLVFKSAGEIYDSQEVEVIGKASFINDPGERKKALEITAERSPVVKYLLSTGNDGAFDCIKVKPEVIKFRIFKEIVQGAPPTIINFEENTRSDSEWALLRKKLANWYTEMRAAFLPASVIPVALGTAIAWYHLGAVNAGYFILALIGGLSLHIGSNIINDYLDHKNGNDEANKEFLRPFSGGSRMIQMGLLSPMEVLAEALFFFLIASFIGLYFAWTKGPFILVLGFVGLMSGYFYTGKSFSWLKMGIGEILIGLNFGPLMALGAYYVQTQQFSWLPVLASVPVGILITAVLYVNEFPDYNADKAVGKLTWVVRLGKKKAAILLSAGLLALYAFVVLSVIEKSLPATTLLILITIPMAYRAIHYTLTYYKSPTDMAPGNAHTASLHLLVGLLLISAFFWEMSLASAGMVMSLVLTLSWIALGAYIFINTEKQSRYIKGLKASTR